MKFKNNNNKIIGELEDGIFKKSVKRSIHFMRNFGAWGIDKSVVDKLEDNCQSIEIHEIESGNTYKVPLKIFLDKSFTKNFGYGEQMFLQEKYFEIKNKNQKTLI